MSLRAVLTGGLLGLLASSFLAPSAQSHSFHLIPPMAAAVMEAQWPGWQGGYPDWDEHRRHCWRMRERLRELRDRISYAPPWERERLESRIFEIRERLREQCWR